MVAERCAASLSFLPLVSAKSLEPDAFDGDPEFFPDSFLELGEGEAFRPLSAFESIDCKEPLLFNLFFLPFLGEPVSLGPPILESNDFREAVLFDLLTLYLGDPDGLLRGPSFCSLFSASKAGNGRKASTSPSSKKESGKNSGAPSIASGSRLFAFAKGKKDQDVAQRSATMFTAGTGTGGKDKKLPHSCHSRSSLPDP